MKQKADIVIYGNLLVNNKLQIGGGNLYSLTNDKLEECFDTTDACIIQGDVSVENFNANDKIVTVIGAVTTKGGHYGSL